MNILELATDRRLRSAASAFGVPVICEVSALLRNLLLARLLGVEEMGKLMLLALALRLVEMGSDLSLDRLMAQAKDGGSLRLQRNLQGAALLRGLASALLILLLAWPFSVSLGDGPSPYSIAYLSLVPLLRSAMHLDYRRYERNLKFRCVLIVDGASAFLALVAVPLAAGAVGDHRAILLIAMLQAAAALLLSHLVATRRYRLAFDRVEFMRIWRFGAPLILNSLLIFVVFQGDKLIVAYGYDWADVGRYAIALQLALLPTQILARTGQSLLLPLFRRALAAGRFPCVEARARGLFLGLSILFLLGYVLLADSILGLLYGTEFQVGSGLAWAFALLGALRLIRAPLSLTAIALGFTRLPLTANLWRVVALLPAIVVAISGQALVLIALCGVAGELAAALAGHRQSRHALDRLSNSPPPRALLAQGLTS
jgi:O-antigen/teichoic acid export membrane protein